MDELRLLSKGLSFAPTLTQPTKLAHKQVLEEYDTYTKSLRRQYVLQMQFHDNPRTLHTPEDSITSLLYRRMKFLPKQQTTVIYSQIPRVDQYIESTRNNLCTHIPEITTNTHENMTKNELNFLKKLKQSKSTVTVKPADKNLGIVLMDTDDYIQQCTRELTKGETYKLAKAYPAEGLK